MPIPRPRKGEKQNAFISRCIDFEKNAAPGRPDDQVQAICYSAWDHRHESIGEFQQSQAITRLYVNAGLTPPKGRGIHTISFHKCVVGYAKKIKGGEMTQDEAYKRCMGALGPKVAVNPSHRRGENIMTKEASTVSWDSVDKSKLPAACFLWVEDTKKKSTWHLPLYMGTGGIDPKTGMYRQRGEINLNALRAASAAIGGARTGRAMSVPSSVRARLNALLKQHKIGQRGSESEQRFACEISFKEATFEQDNDTPIIRNVVLLGAESKNKRRYERDAMRNAASMYEGIQAFLNHPSPDEEKMGSRDVRLLAGGYANVNFDESAMKIRGDFIGLPNDSASRKYVNIAQHAPHLAGNSHNANGKIRMENGIEVVEEIKKVFSVDLVTNPATTSGVFESNDNLGEKEMDYNEVTMVGLKEARPDLVEQLVAEGEKSRDEEVKNLTKERDDAVKEADEMKAKIALAEKQELVDKLLGESELPDEAKTEVFRNMLLKLQPEKEGETIEAKAKEMIDDRMAAVTGKAGVKNNTEKTGDVNNQSPEQVASELKEPTD